jgi:hypothetical protein
MTPPPTAENVMRVLTNGQIIEHVMGKRYKKYAFKECRMENICGHLLSNTYSPTVKRAAVKGTGCMGWQHDIYSIYGNGSLMSLSSNNIFFKGCRNLQGLHSFAKDLGIGNYSNQVHMSVASGCLGMLIDVRNGGLVYNILRKMLLHPYYAADSTNTIRFRKSPNIDLGGICPKTNDWVLTIRGCVIIRMTWDAQEWSQELEEKLVRYCQDEINLLIEFLNEAK